MDIEKEIKMTTIEEIMKNIKPLLEAEFTDRIKNHIKTVFPNELSKEDKKTIRNLAKEEFKDALLEVQNSIETEIDDAQDNIERSIEIEFWDSLFPDNDSKWNDMSDTEPESEYWSSTESQATCGCDYESVIENEKPGIQTHNVDLGNWDEIEIIQR